MRTDSEHTGQGALAVGIYLGWVGVFEFLAETNRGPFNFVRETFSNCSQGRQVKEMLYECGGDTVFLFHSETTYGLP